MPPALPRDELTGGRYFRMVLLLGTLLTLTPLSIDMYLPALPQIATDLNGTTSQAQGTVTVMLIGMGVGQIVIGPLSDMWGRRIPLLIGAAAHVLMSLGMTFVNSMWLMLVMRTLQGFAGAAITVVVMACVTDLFVGRRAAAAFSQLILVLGVAPIFAPSIGSVLMTFMPWRGLFFALVVAGVFIFLLALFALPETHPPEKRSPARIRGTLGGYRRILADKVYIAMLVVTGMQMASMFTFVSLSSFVFQGVYGMDAQLFGLVFGATAMVSIGVLQTNALFLRRFSPARVLRVALIAGTGLALLMAVLAWTNALTVIWFTVIATAINAVSGLAGPNSQAIGMRQNQHRAGQASALIGAARFAIAGTVAPVVGMVPQTSALPIALAMATALGLGLIATMVVWRTLDTPDYD